MEVFPCNGLIDAAAGKVGRRCAHWKERLVLTIVENPHNFFQPFGKQPTMCLFLSVSHGGGCEGEFMKFEDYICSLSGGGVRARY